MRVTLTIGKAPRRQIVRGEVLSEESVSAREGNGIRKNGTGNSVTRTETCAFYDGLCVLSLQTNV